MGRADSVVVPGCSTCELVRRRDRGEAPPWDEIWRTPSWDVVHCDGTAIEGWLVLACREHRSSLADLSDTEAAALGPLLKLVSAALHDVVGCEKTYAVQFAEHPEHPHVHVHVIARPPGLADALKGPRIFDRAGLPEDECVPVDRMNELAAGIAAFIATADAY